MKKENTLLIIVDVQNDFVHGSLATQEAKEAVPHMVAYAEDHKAKGLPILLTKDTHYEDTYFDTQEGHNLPVLHCIKGTEGHNFVDELKDIEEYGLVIEKETFGSNVLVEEARKLIDNDEVDNIVLMGLCTDICVISNYVLLKTAFPETLVSIYEPGCAGVTVEQHDHAINVMGNALQANIIRKGE